MMRPGLSKRLSAYRSAARTIVFVIASLFPIAIAILAGLAVGAALLVLLAGRLARLLTALLAGPVIVLIILCHARHPLIHIAQGQALTRRAVHIIVPYKSLT